jgi:hypothetical protein
LPISTWPISSRRITSRIAEQYHAPKLRGPFNFEARRDAGFDEAELAALVALAGLDAEHSVPPAARD